jgi:uncharacterized protein YabN with tetrapyrrole methylase and pyrophosphatase domain
VIPDITVAGMGVAAVVQVTAQTEARIRQCRHALHVDSGVGTDDFLAARCPRVTGLYGLTYGETDSRVAGYHHAAAAVIEAAMTEPPVIYLTHGHPLVFCYSAFLIRDLAGLLSLSVELLPGISSMDSLFADLWLDPGVGGIQMFEATDLLLRRRRLQPDVPALIWQVGNLETRLYTTRTSRPVRMVRFRDWLLQTYPADHPITACYASPHPAVGPQRWTFPLADLPAHAAALHPGITLYVPPCAVRPVQDFALLNALDSVEHLLAITEE